MCLFHLPTKEDVAFIHSIKLGGKEVINVRVLDVCPVMLFIFTGETPRLLPEENSFFVNQLWSTSFMREKRVLRGCTRKAAEVEKEAGSGGKEKGGLTDLRESWNSEGTGKDGNQ